MRLRLCALASCLVVSAAHARPWDQFQGGTTLHYELTGVGAIDDGTHRTTIQELILAGARLHGFVATGETVWYHVGLDLAAGSTLDAAGFAYDVDLIPLGVAVRFGRSSFVTTGIGIGAMGAMGALDDALTIPLEATLEAGGRVRVLARARATYLSGAAPRDKGAGSIAFADELETMVGVRVGHHYEDYGFPSGNGYFVGAAYRELMGARYIGLTIGYSIDLATPPKRDRRGW